VNGRRRAPADIVALVGVVMLASISGLWNRFTFDDEPIIMANPHIHSLDALWRVWGSPYWPPELGGTLYRPLTMLAFATEWLVGRGSPLVFHLVNILLYAAVCLAVYALASLCMPRAVAWVVAAVFGVHPVHVEVVANAVGQAELLAALATIVATGWYVRCRARGGPRAGDVVGLTLLYIAGCLSKEHAIVLPLLLVAAELSIVSAPTARRRLWPLGVSLACAAVAYVGLRAIVLHGVVGEIPAVEFRGASMGTRWWTMAGIAGQWLRLLVWPSHLAAIYSPPAVPMLDHPTLAVVPVLVCIALLVVVALRSPPAVGFGLAWAAVCLLPTSNVIVPTGVFLAERTLFLPSVGVLVAAGAAASLVRSSARPALAAAAIVIALGAWKSAARQRVWHDDARFFAQAAADEPRSYAAHYEWARMLLATGQQEAGVREAERAESLYGSDPELTGLLGRQYARAGRCGDAVPLLRQTVMELPGRAFARERLARCLVQLGDTAEADRIARDGGPLQ
jgi:protein O-mannosyl-transferase